MLQKINTNLSTEECIQQIKSQIKDYKKVYIIIII